MNPVFKTTLIILFSLTATFTAHSQSKIRTLQEAYADYFTIGCAINMGNIVSTDHALQLKQMYNSLTAENDMKPSSTQPVEGIWTWSNADNIAMFASRNGIPLRGHCLVWHQQTGDWMFHDEKGELVSKEVLFERMKHHIETVMGRYKGRIYAWDVVNEAIADSPDAPHPYRESLYYKIAGDEFIRKAFEFARATDPDALLFYNDYSECDPVKRDRIYNMVKSMKADGVPIDGIGMQGHYNVVSPTESQFREALDLYSSIVDHIHITELDVRINTLDHGGQLHASTNSTGQYTPEMEKIQGDQYEMLFRVMREYKDVIENVTFWNTDDKDSWLDRRGGNRARNYPLLFDDDLNPKSPYYRVINF